MLGGDQAPGHRQLDVGPDVGCALACRAVHLPAGLDMRKCYLSSCGIKYIFGISTLLHQLCHLKFVEKLKFLNNVNRSLGFRHRHHYLGFRHHICFH